MKVNKNGRWYDDEIATLISYTERIDQDNCVTYSLYKKKNGEYFAVRWMPHTGKIFFIADDDRKLSLVDEIVYANQGWNFEELLAKVPELLKELYSYPNIIPEEYRKYKID